MKQDPDKSSVLAILTGARFAALCWLLVPAVMPAQATAPVARQSTGIVIVPALEKPAAARPVQEKDMGGYLMVYFKDQTHSAYFAISRAGRIFTDVNGGEPVFDGTALAEQKGVRDPHIARGPDGAFYLAMTDLHIFGRRAGHRETEWQRPQEKYGWGNNRALVLMKSWDLIHWTHSDFRVDLAFPELGDIDCSWAPETVWDPKTGKMVVYFTIRYGNKNANIYWACADEAFTKLETTPRMIPGVGGIDADLTLVDGQWRMFYVSDAKIRYASSERLADGYRVTPQRIDPESVSTEAPNLFKRLGTSTYVLMYDVYGARPNNMGFSETEDFVTWRNLGHFNEGPVKGTNFERPKHGAVIHLTTDELRAVAAHWKMDLPLD
ncbi:MAG TPA: glycoside hydrolase family 43 protein [Lacunisphaera sp.]